MISDRVFKREAEDKSGSVASETLKAKLSNVSVVHTATVPDEVHDIRKVVSQWADQLKLPLIITSGRLIFNSYFFIILPLLFIIPA